jgi:hypothetical protein
MPSFRYKGFPWISYFFAERLPILESVRPKVFAAFRNHSNLSMEDALLALKRDVEPKVQLVDMPGLYGYTPPGRNIIQLGKTFVLELEAALANYQLPRADYHAPTDLEIRALLLLEATVLHEMVHYFRLKTLDQARINISSSRGRSFEEAVGDRFEMDAYGYQPDVRNTLMERYLPKTAAYMGEGN